MSIPVIPFAKKVNNEAMELELYGEIVESRPKDWFGKEVEGSYIVQQEVIDSLNEVKSLGKKSVVMRIHSVGGDAAVSLLIHNKLRELSAEGIETKCIVDGIAMSGGSIIMSACDSVSVFPSSLIMIHKAITPVCGWFNADDFENAKNSCDAWDNAIVESYKRKTKLGAEKIRNMMSATTYITGKEAISKGFADVLLEGEGIELLMSAKGDVLYAGQLPMKFPFEAPENIKRLSAAETDDINKEYAKGGKTMATNLAELREENPELAATIEGEISASFSADTEVANERRRIQEIDRIACLYSPELVDAAKYGEHACTAQELAFRAAEEAVKSGTNFLNGAMLDAQGSNANAVPSSAVANDEGKVLDESEKKAYAEQAIHQIFHGKEEK